jgi:chlorite dismutase
MDDANNMNDRQEGISLDNESRGALASHEGLCVLHLFCSSEAADADAQGVIDALKSFNAAGGQSLSVAMLGHKSDVGIMALAPDMWMLRELQTSVKRAGLVVNYSYLSLTEVSEYAEGLPEQVRSARLYPKLPPEGMNAFCFYPMSKRRQPGRNWYVLTFDERRSLMNGHGQVGREYRGRVVQLVTGSTGLDDYEWGVSLFATGPDEIKACVYEMRFDPASAHYGDFGPFYTGVVASIEDVLGSCI